MTLEFIKGIKDEDDVCFLSTQKIRTIKHPLWLTKEDFDEIKKLMNW